LNFTSDPAFNNGYISPDGSTFNISLNTPLRIPKNALSCYLETIDATIWYVQPNISTALINNTFVFIYNGNTYNVVIQDGIYSLDGLNEYLSKYFLSLGFKSNLLVISGDYSTQKTIITYNDTNLQIDFTQSTIRSVLGFNPAIVPAVIQPVDYYVYSDTEAKFNTINNFYIASSLLSVGLPLNNSNNSIIAKVNITPNSVGRQIIYQPQVPIKISCDELIGKTIQNISFSLLDDKFRPAPTLGESYTFVIRISYDIAI
jgi:hypothetical protein